MLKKSGVRAYFEIKFFPITIEGKIVGIQGIVRDASERKKVEEEISSLLKFSTENPNPIIRLNKDGFIRFANQAGQTLLEELGNKVGDQAPQFWIDLVDEAFSTNSTRYWSTPRSLAFVDSS